MTSPSPWTDDHVETAKRMWGDGNSAAEIACVIGRTRNAVCGKLMRMGLMRDKTKAETTANRVRSRRLNAGSSPKARRQKVATPAKPVPAPPTRSELPPPPRCAPRVNNRSALPGSSPVADITETEGCKYPVEGYPYHWCNEPKSPGKSWCDAHCAIVFQQDVKALKPREGTGTFKSLGEALRGVLK